VTHDIPQHQPPIAARFERVRRRLRNVRVAAGCIAGLGLLAAAILLVDAADFLHALREPWVLRLVSLGALLAGAVLVRAGLRATFRGPTARDLALDVERARPELLDALVCAVELEDCPNRAPNPVEAALLAQVQERLSGSAPLDEVFQRGLRWRRLVLPALIFAACMGVALNSRAWRKATAHLSDLVRGTSTGLVLQAPSAPVPERSDVRLEADVRRWEPEASIEYLDAEGRHRFRMNRGEGTRSFFTFYDVTQTVRYRVLTPSLASPWRRIETYRPPSFEQVTFRIEPPAYTGREPQEHDGFRDLQAVVGSRLAIQVRTQPGVSAELRWDGPPMPFAAAGDGQLRQALTVDRDRVFRVALRSPAGWEATSQEVRLVAQPDLPPVITLLKPQRDAQAGEDETVPLLARAADDFGVRRIMLSYAVSGAARQSVILFEPGTERVLDQTAEYGFDLEALKARPGDVISYCVSAVDNREPEPQEARTEVCFIVVRPKLEAKDKEGNQGEQKKLDIGPLIAESKRLIRLTWDALGLPAGERAKPAEDLHRDLNVLRLEIRKVFTQVLQMSGGQVSGPIPELFGAAEREVAEAVRLVENRLLEESQSPQERALSALIRIENELLQNAASCQSKGDSSGSPPPKPPEASPEQSRSQQQALQAMRDAKRKVQELAERQSRLNQELQRASTLSPEAAKGLAQKQRGIEADTGAVAKDLAALEPARRAADTLTAAAGEMSQGAARLDQTDVTTAERHGRRAGGLLDAAVKDLDEALRKAAADRVRALAKAAEQLSDAQRAAADASRELAAQPQPPPEALGAAEQTQRQLNQSAAELRAAVDRTAGELDEPYPDVSQALGEALQTANRQGLERTMNRAANALLYRKPDKAVKPQTDAANQLLEFAQGLQAAAGKLPALSREELLEALQAMQQQARQTAQAMQQPGAEGQKQLESIREQASQALDPLAAALQDPSLREVADQMGSIGAGSSAETGEQMLRLFRAAIGILERHVTAAEVKRRLDLSRRTSVPPEKYRRQVEQYFRDLGREP